AAQITSSEHSFSRPWGVSPLFLLTQGYGVMVGPSMPILGEGEAEPNDTYLQQLTLSAEAAVSYLASRGIGDRTRMAIAGQSYGAFTTANLLAHTDLFQAGIALSGAYNRTLTPFGFQGEQRTFWQAPGTYMAMSPFAHADQINHPLLLIHGAEDANPGTYPLQSERLYGAMRGLAGTVRWVELPHEGHGYRSREAIGHTLWEITRWLDFYLSPGEMAASAE
ncbi:S9 family peptidase, partial [filamentous cyanobacterium CCP5]